MSEAKENLQVLIFLIQAIAFLCMGLMLGVIIGSGVTEEFSKFIVFISGGIAVMLLGICYLIDSIHTQLAEGEDPEYSEKPLQSLLEKVRSLEAEKQKYEAEIEAEEKRLDAARTREKRVHYEQQTAAARGEQWGR